MAVVPVMTGMVLLVALEAEEVTEAQEQEALEQVARGIRVVLVIMISTLEEAEAQGLWVLMEWHHPELVGQVVQGSNIQFRVLLLTTLEAEAAGPIKGVGLQVLVELVVAALAALEVAILLSMVLMELQTRVVAEGVEILQVWGRRARAVQVLLLSVMLKHTHHPAHSLLPLLTQLLMS